MDVLNRLIMSVINKKNIVVYEILQSNFPLNFAKQKKPNKFARNLTSWSFTDAIIFLIDCPVKLPAFNQLIIICGTTIIDVTYGQMVRPKAAKSHSEHRRLYDEQDKSSVNFRNIEQNIVEKCEN